MSLKHTAINIAIVLSAVTLSACGKQPVNIEQFGLITSPIQTKTYTIQSAKKGEKQADILHIFIEGDGYAYVSKSRPSSNPTPINSVLLNLMKFAPEGSVYLGRPCQFIKNKPCQQSDWTTERYADRHVNALNEAVDNLKESSDAKSLVFVGHSGGGTMAALIAHKRKQQNKNDVKAIITLAGNLNLEGFAYHHKVTKMTGVDPAMIANQIKGIPQVHYSGSDDKIVPDMLLYKYMIHSGRQCVSFKTLSSVSHTEGWERYVEYIYENTPKCKERK